MEIKVISYKGYEISYDNYKKTFILRNEDGVEMGTGFYQADVETIADRLEKASFQFPIKALETHGLEISSGKVTSINLSDPSIRFIEDTEGAGHHKVSLKYGSKVYASTPGNESIKTQVDKYNKSIEELRVIAKGLMAKLESPIDLGYFGLKDRYGR